MALNIRRYDPADGARWDSFIQGSKNGTFLFARGFMDYHADRFADHSLIAEVDSRIVAVLPANRSERTLHSHQGLSYGGWISDAAMTTSLMLSIFDETRAFAAAHGIDEIVYKCMPRIYHCLPADEDLYALFRADAVLFRRDLSTALDLAAPIVLSSQRKRNISKANKASLQLTETGDVRAFHQLLSGILLENHQTAPVHSADELTMLMARFPQQIRLFLCEKDGHIYAGSLVFETPGVAHTQYLASSPEGRNCGALDYLLHHLISSVYKDKKFFSFGVSTESGGRVLNEGLVSQKEGFGGRAIVHDFYRIGCAGAA